MSVCTSIVRRSLRRPFIRVISFVFSVVSLSGVTLAQNADPSQVQSFEDWRVSCAEAVADNCRVWQRVQVAHGDGLQDVMAVSVAPADNGLVVLFQVPLDVYLPADFGLRVDGTGERRVRYRNCNETGCWVLLRGDSGVLGSFRRGITAEAALSLVEGETIRISFSLRGFTAAMAAFEDARRTLED